MARSHALPETPTPPGLFAPQFMLFCAQLLASQDRLCSLNCGLKITR
jgi:hypothetical protein